MINKISVCMATHNGEKYIRRQLASIVGQAGDNDEIVISDDSSTDATVAIIKSFSDPRIRLLEHNTFYSPVFNLENALKKATGDIIVLADQDDIWLDNKIRLVREHLQGKTGAVYLIMFDGSVIDDRGEVLCDSLFERKKAGKGMMKNIYDNTYMGCCLAFSRELLKIALPFPEKIPMHDVWLGLLAEIYGDVELIGEKTILHRRHGENASPFTLRFDPVRQIARRCYLVYYLIRRYIAGPSGGEKRSGRPVI